MENFYLKTNKGKILDGVIIFKPIIHEDNRGFFYESWNKYKFEEIIKQDLEFLQDNVSFSKKGVLRGIHYQNHPKEQGKLIRCSKGKIYDVAVDLRKDSPTFGEWTSIILSAKNKFQLWIPPEFGHGFLSLTHETVVNYKATNFWSKSCERSIIWNDNDLLIQWPIDKLKGKKIMVSEKDSKSPTFKTAIQSGDIF